MKYMSVITNFGCHYKCPYCIVKENNLHIPKTTVAGLDNLRKSLKENGCNIISLSGGGDPLHEYDKHIEEYLRMGHKKLWWYIEQNDYNLYYAENQVSTRYRDFEKEVQV